MPQQVLDVLSLLGALLLMCGVFAAAYLVSRFMGRRYGGMAGGKKGKIEILEQTPLGRERALLLVRAGGRVFLLGAFGQHIEKIAELDGADFPPEGEGPAAPPDFLEALKEAWKERKGGGKAP